MAGDMTAAVRLKQLAGLQASKLCLFSIAQKIKLKFFKSYCQNKQKYEQNYLKIASLYQ